LPRPVGPGHLEFPERTLYLGQVGLALIRDELLLAQALIDGPQQRLVVGGRHIRRLSARGDRRAAQRLDRLWQLSPTHRRIDL
jgi:hypothetical protein